MAVLAAAALKFSERDRRLVLRDVRRRVMRTLQVAGFNSSSALEIEPWGAGEGHPPDEGV